MEHEEKFRSKEFEAVVETMRKNAYQQQHILESDLGWETCQYHRLYLDVPPFVLSDGRTMKIKVVQTPVYTFENKPVYYTQFFIYTDWWMAENMPSIRQLLNSIMQKQGFDRWWEKTGNYSIFIFGRQRGHFNYKSSPQVAMLRKHNAQAFNTHARSKANIMKDLFRNISTFLYGRVNGTTEKGKQAIKRFFGQLRKDRMRLKDLSDGLYKKFWKICRAIVQKIKRYPRYPLNNPPYPRKWVSNICSNTKVNKRKRKLQIPNFNNKDYVIIKPV